ncbi:hypothetical protein [Streptomyces sp. NPDC003015]
MRALLFLDVDGTLLPFGAAGPYPLYEPAFPLPDAATGRPLADTDTDTDTVSGHPLLSRVNPALGVRLTSLGCALVWATTWGDDANTVLAPWLGLPRLPLVDWPDSDDEEGTGLHWKTRLLVSWAAGRPFVWVDDEITDADRAWVAARHPGRALLHRVEPQVGLTDRDFAVLEEWLASKGR